MRAVSVCGMVLFAIAILALAYQAVVYATHTGAPNQPEPTALILSIIAAVIGLVMWVFGYRRRVV